MTDYKTQKGLTEAYSPSDEKFKKTTKHFLSEKEKAISSNLESDFVIQKYSKYTKTFSAPIQAIEPSSFAFFGKSEQYYSDSVYSIINYYPFDGTHEETLDWFVSASNLDTSLLQQEWPTSVGHLSFSGPEYVTFYAGPQSIAEETHKGKVRNQESALRLDADKGTTVEFWLKKPSRDNAETIFEIGTHPSVATTDTDEDRVRFKLSTTATTSEVDKQTSLSLTYISASNDGGSVSQIGPQDLIVGYNSGQRTLEMPEQSAVVFSKNLRSFLVADDSDTLSPFENRPGQTRDDHMTFSFWVNIEDDTEARETYLFGKWRSGSEYYCMYEGGPAGVGMKFNLFDQQNAVDNFFYAPTHPETGKRILEDESGNWVHITIAYQASAPADNAETVTFYKNGIQWGDPVPTDAFSSGIPLAYARATNKNSVFVLGDRENKTSILSDRDNRFVGMMSNFLIFKHDGQSGRSSSSLTSEQVLSLYNDGNPMRDYNLHAKSSDLVAYWKLNEDSTSDTMADSSGINNNITSVGSDVASNTSSGIFLKYISSENSTDWHHYALKVWQTETEGADTYTINTKLYVDGELSATNSQDIGTIKITTADNAMAGRIGLELDAANPASGTPLSSSIDSFRFWKGLRTSREIGRYYDQKVYASDHRELDYVSRLGVKYTFNEASIGDATRDKLIIDYSGNDVIATINNYTESARVSTSAIDLSTSSTNTEIKDPILFEIHSEVVSLKNRLEQIGKSYDIQNSNTLNKKVPGWLFNEMYELGNTSEMDILLHMLASVFDGIMTNLKSLRKLTRPEYTNSRSSFITNDTQNAFKSTLESLSSQEKGEVFNTFTYENKIDFMERLLENYGFSRSEYKFLWDLKTEEVVESIVENIRMERSAQEIRSVLYDCLANAASFALKRKGTESSYNSFLNAVGLGRDVISFNILGQNAELKLDKQSVDTLSVKQKSISFLNNSTSNLHQTASTVDERSYLQAPPDESEFTFEGNFIFPRNKNNTYEVVDSSVFGLYEVASSNNDFTFSDPNNCSFQISVVKNSSLSSDAKFVLSSRHSIIEEQVTDIIKDVYDGTVWNLSLKLYKDTEIGHTSNSALSEYKLEFAGYNYLLDELRKSFKKTINLTTTFVNNLQDSNKTVFIGADRENINGTLYKKTDIKVLGFNSWTRALTDSELKRRASHLTSYGIESPYIYPNVANRADIKNPEFLSSLVMKMQLADYTSTKLEESGKISDETSGNSDLRSFFGDLRGHSYPMVPFGFSEKQEESVVIEHLPSIRNVPITNVQGLDGISIKNSDIDYHEKDSKPELKLISFEKSMYRVITNEMLDFISGINSFNNLIGEPVNKYRQNYKFMDYLKRSFFTGVDNESQLERFITYYRWLDKSIGHFLSFLVPGSTVSNTGIENVVESHLLERNKIHYKLPRLEHKELEDLEGVVLGIEARDNEREDQAGNVAEDSNIEMEEREEEQSEHRSAFTSAVLGQGSTTPTRASNYSRYAQRVAFRPYKTSAQNIKTLSLGSNSNSNNIKNYFANVNSGKQIIISSDNVTKKKETHETINNKGKRKFEVWTTSDINDDYANGSGDLLLPISFYNVEGGSDFADFKQDLVISNKLNNPRAVQGMFGTRVNITQPHRNVPVGAPSSERPEAYQITIDSSQMVISQPTGLSSVFHKNSEREIFYNITNIKNDSEKGIYGNYAKDSEILFTTGLTTNNRHFIKSGGTDSIQSFVESVQVPQLVDFPAPERKKQEHIIVSTFNGAMTPELSGRYGKDSFSSEYSVYSGMNNRNGLVREVLNNLSAEYSNQFGIRSGSTTNPSWHKVNRNTRYYHNQSTLDVKNNNLFVQNHIPQSDFGYTWISKSAHNNIEDFLKNNMNMGHQHNYELPGGGNSDSLIEFVSSSLADSELDFVGLNYKNQKTFNSDYNTVTNSSNSLNGILLNLNGAAGWPTWKQTRAGDTLLARKQKKENIYSIVFEGDSPMARPKPGSKFDYKRTVENSDTHTVARTTRNYLEIPVTKRFFPLSYSVQPVEDLEIANLLSYKNQGYNSQEINSILWSVDWSPSETEVYDIGLTKIIMKIDAQNNASFFANEQMSKEVDFFVKPILESKQIDRLNVFINQVNSSEISYGTSPQMNYKEKIYPREVNTFTKKVRVRSKFDFFGWRNERQQREINMSGNISYGDFLFSSINLAPDRQVTTRELDFTNCYFNEYDLVDLNAFDSSFDISLSTHLTQSRWVLDARKDFAEYPVDIKDSYFSDPTNFMSARDQGTRGAGILQNDYSLFPLGINAAFGAPPIAPVYNRRVIQNYETSSFLAGESIWEAADSQDVGPFYENYETYAEKTKIIGKEYSLVPEFAISRYTKNLLTTADLENEITNISDFLYLTGTEHESCSNDPSSSEEFFKSYSNSDFLKYFLEIQENNKKNNFDLSPDIITMRTRGVKKLLPYRGFYPAERIVQISEIFNENYLPDSTYTTTFFKSNIFVSSQSDAENLIKLRIQNSKAQALKPLMAPGVLLNSIKTGLAVDYPIFKSSPNSALLAILNATAGSETSMFSDLSLLPSGSDLCFTGSELNSSQDLGVPRIKGNVAKRVTFEDLLDPSRLYGEILHDNEPHPSASLLYGSKYHVALLERPATFGSLDKDTTKRHTGIDFASSQLLFKEKFSPYKSAVHNFTAETVNFFLEDGKLTTLISDAVSPELTENKKYKMYVYLENTGITMYDRHSAFGPAVDDGDAQITSYDFETTITTPGTAASGSLDFSDSRFDDFSYLGNDELHMNVIIFFTDSSSTAATHVYQFDTSGDSSKQTGDTFSTSTLPSWASGATGVYIQVKDLFDRELVVAQVITAITGTSGHGSTLTTSYDNSTKTLNLTNASVGVDTTVITPSHLGLESSTRITALGFGGGVDDVTTTSSFMLAPTTQVSSGSHGYLPYVPPYLDPNTSPYAEITFTPTATDRYTIPQIIEGSTIEYYNLPSVTGASGTNYDNSMNIEASLELKNYVALKRDNYTYSVDSEKSVASSTRNPQSVYRWVIHPRWETPILDFSNSTVSALNLDGKSVAQVQNSPWKKRYQDKYYEESTDSTVPYLTASTGMWHQKGELLPLDNKTGYTLGISGPYVKSSDDEIQNLAEVLGFTPKGSKSSAQAATITYGNKRLGNIAKNKDICEAVVAIPYYEDKAGNMQLFQINNLELSRAKTLNTRKKNQYYLDYVAAAPKDKNKKLDEYYAWSDDSGLSNNSNCAYQLRMMDKYIIPPNFDFTRNDNVNPHVQYIFQFKSRLTREDLANLWQNLYPESSSGPATAQHSRVSQNKTDILQNIPSQFLDKEYSMTSLRKGNSSFFKNPEIFNNEKVRWLVFKSKFRAVKDYSQIVKKSISPFDEDIMEMATDTSLPSNSAFNNYGFNWPYDYFSLVELADLTAKVDLSRNSTIEASDDADATSTGFEIITTIQEYEQQSETSTESSSFVNKNFVNVTTSGTEQLIFKQTLKTETDAAPSPANQMTVVLPDGYSIKSGSESIYLNGVLQVQGSSNDYTLSGGVISFNYDIDSSDGVVINYILSETE